MQIIFVYFVLFRSSSSIRIDDDTLPGRSIELRIHAFGDAGHVFLAFSYRSQPLF